MVNTTEADYSDWKGWNEDAFGKFSSEDEEYYTKEILDRLSEDQKGDFLEIGFGNGSLLGWAKTKFTNASGVEKSKFLTSRAKYRGFDAYNDIEEALIGKKLDVVVAMDVLEHMTSSDIYSMFNLVRGRLRPGGLFIARFPNGDSPFGRINQNGDDTHINAIGVVKIATFAERSGLTLAYFGAPATLSPKGMRNKFDALITKFVRREFERWMAKIYLPRKLYLGMNYLVVYRNEDALST